MLNAVLQFPSDPQLNEQHSGFRWDSRRWDRGKPVIKVVAHWSANFKTQQFNIEGNPVSQQQWLDHIGSFSRASSKSVGGIDGLLHTIGIDELPYDHDYNGNPLGLLLEPASGFYFSTADTHTVNSGALAYTGWSHQLQSDDGDVFGGNSHRLITESNSTFTTPRFMTSGWNTQGDITASVFWKPIARQFFGIRFSVVPTTGLFDIGESGPRYHLVWGDEENVEFHRPVRYGNGFWRIALTLKGLNTNPQQPALSATELWDPPLNATGNPQSQLVAGTQVGAVFGYVLERGINATSFSTVSRAADNLQVNSSGGRLYVNEDEVGSLEMQPHPWHLETLELRVA